MQNAQQFSYLFKIEIIGAALQQSHTYDESNFWCCTAVTASPITIYRADLINIKIIFRYSRTYYKNISLLKKSFYKINLVLSISQNNITNRIDMLTKNSCFIKHRAIITCPIKNTCLNRSFKMWMWSKIGAHFFAK